MLKPYNAKVKPGGVAVTNRRGELVCYVMLEKAFVAPGATPDEARQAGEEADNTIEIEARKAGATSVVLVLSPEHPHFPEERWIRIVERSIPQNITMPEAGSKTSAQAFIN